MKPANFAAATRRHGLSSTRLVHDVVPVVLAYDIGGWLKPSIFKLNQPNIA